VIRKQDILDRAAEWQLRADVVEKDYVLGWLLAGLAEMSFGKLWVFKGGTCIKKCYFETYRFSEDLDFSLLPDTAYTQEALTQQLRELTSRVGELSGLEFSPDLIDVKTRRNQQGQPTFEGRVAYRGPLVFPGSPKIRFDFTQHEAVIDAVADRTVLHPYPDEFPSGITVRAYSFNELLAEKTRALLERSRPRDLYDIVHLIENAPSNLDLAAVRALFRRKCESKTIAVPSSVALVAGVSSDDELRSEWGNMLGHQLPALPDLDGMLGRLPGLLAWLDFPAQPRPEARLGRVPIPAGNTRIVAPGIQYWGSSSPLEAVRFAGSNRLLVEFDYHGKHRLVEPYSVRRAQTGNVLLYGWELAAGHIKAFKIAEMRNVRSTGASFLPRYRVEV
jgi:predicted nucleotidyltransferase component of viral defense system